MTWIISITSSNQNRDITICFFSLMFLTRVTPVSGPPHPAISTSTIMNKNILRILPIIFPTNHQTAKATAIEVKEVQYFQKTLWYWIRWGFRVLAWRAARLSLSGQEHCNWWVSCVWGSCLAYSGKSTCWDSIQRKYRRGLETRWDRKRFNTSHFLFKKKSKIISIALPFLAWYPLNRGGSDSNCEFCLQAYQAWW